MKKVFVLLAATLATFALMATLAVPAGAATATGSTVAAMSANTADDNSAWSARPGCGPTHEIKVNSWKAKKRGYWVNVRNRSYCRMAVALGRVRAENPKRIKRLGHGDAMRVRIPAKRARILVMHKGRLQLDATLLLARKKRGGNTVMV